MEQTNNTEGIQLITTKDGSHSLVNLGMDETYHSRHGAVQESKHVFIENGLHAWLAQCDSQEVKVFEVGMGTGLNTLLTLQEALAANRVFYYTTLEPFPLSPDILSKLNYPECIKDARLQPFFEKVHACPWEQDIQLHAHFTFNKVNNTLQKAEMPPSSFDVIYYDAFAPNKQAGMWTYEMLEKVTSLLKPNGIWVTYAAKGQMKRDLKNLHLQVETLPGPPGKAEMVRARKV